MTVFSRTLRFWPLALASVLVLVLGRTAVALDVKILPAAIKLGDTVSVVMDLAPSEKNCPATVQTDNKTYPVFAISPRRCRAFVPTSPLDRPGRRTLQVQSSQESRNLAFWLGDRSFPTQRIWLPEGKAGNDGTDYEFDRVGEFKALVTPEKLWNGPFRRPNQGEITTGYGVRRYYNGKFAQDYYHRGIDYAGSSGSPVTAPAAGRVALVGRESAGNQSFQIHGNTVGLDHGQGVTSIYLHLSRIDVQEGQMVRAGQVIGAVGSTGASTGPHLHWGLYVNGVSVDPAPWRYDAFE